MMRNLVVYPAKKLWGTLEVPGDKSISHRSIMMGSLAYGITRVSHFLNYADCLSTMGIFKNMGVKIAHKGDRSPSTAGASTPSSPPKKY